MDSAVAESPDRLLLLGVISEWETWSVYREYL